MANQLGLEKSPYLLQHKDNPVNWYPWCREAFQKARDEDKPVFLSIGYSTCHWCHVMAHESFEDDETARLLDDFICIKVDREERPDIDAVYMTVCQALTGSGGWPLTVLMTPDQKPFFAGTYFPRTSRYGHLGLQDLLRQITQIWRSDREKLFEAGDRIISAIENAQLPTTGMPNRELLRKGYRLLCQSFDSAWGGFGRAPKFPAPHNLLFLMRIAEAEKEADALQMAERTLQAMSVGGIFDHIGGGFSRYSTDEKWLVPHFEKMLYDNALLILAYLEAFQLTQNQQYADTARWTADYILRELTDPQGGFYCGQDADSDGVEGKYYLFTPEEVKHVLGEANSIQFCQMYNITTAGNFEGKSIPNRIEKFGPGWDAGDPRLLSLLEYRMERTKLHLDHKILLSWNAWTIMALAMAGSILDDSHYLDAAIKAQAFIKSAMADEKGRLYHRFCDGEAAHDGQLDDYATYSLALVELYSRTFDVNYLKEAVLFAKQMLDLFEDKHGGGFYMTAHDAQPLITRPKEIYDGTIPSGNSTAAMVLERLAELTGESLFREAADRQLAFLAGQAKDYPAGYCYALLAMSGELYPHRELLCTGDHIPDEIVSYIRTKAVHGLSILYKSKENAAKLAQLAPFTENYPVSDSPMFYLCENGACRRPKSEFKQLNL